MKVIQTMKYPGAKEYEMHYFSIELSELDLPSVSDFDTMPTKVKLAILQYMMQRECVIFAVTRGLISIDKKDQQMSFVNALLPGEVKELLKKHGI